MGTQQGRGAAHQRPEQEQRRGHWRRNLLELPQPPLRGLHKRQGRAAARRTQVCSALHRLDGEDVLLVPFGAACRGKRQEDAGRCVGAGVHEERSPHHLHTLPSTADRLHTLYITMCRPPVGRQLLPSELLSHMLTLLLLLREVEVDAATLLHQGPAAEWDERRDLCDCRGVQGLAGGGHHKPRPPQARCSCRPACHGEHVAAAELLYRHNDRQRPQRLCRSSLAAWESQKCRLSAHSAASRQLSGSGPGGVVE